jgi:hypothetical protein
MKKITSKCLSLIFLFSFFSIISLKAQETNKTGGIPVNSSEVILRIKGLRDERLCARIKETFGQYKSKILNYSINPNNNTVTVVISDKLQKVDLLEVLQMNDIHAGYLNENREYVTIDEDGNLTPPINMNK